MNKLPILIIGAGPTGLTLAIELARRNIPCRIVDKIKTPTVESRAGGIHARTQEVFEIMGVIQPILDASLKAKQLTIHADDQLIKINYSLADSPYNAALMIPQADTEAILRDELRKLGVMVDYNKGLQSLSQDADKVTAALQDDSGNTEECVATFLVGCDGAHSKVRHELQLSFKGSDISETWIMADVDVDWPDGNEGVNAYSSEKGLYLFIPFKDGRCRVGADHRLANIDPDSDPTVEELESLAANYLKTKPTFKKVHWLTKFRIHYRATDTYQQGRVFLAGDSAHIHSPAGGQGMNNGIQDAFNLGWKLALVYQGKMQQKLLHSYNDERIPIGHGVLRLAKTMTQIVTLRSPWLRKIRNFILHFMTQFTEVQKRMINKIAQLKINYRGSPMVMNDSASHGGNSLLSAGDRAPNVTLIKTGDNQSVRLFELLQSGKHCLLTIGGEQQIKQVIQKQFSEVCDVYSIAPSNEVRKSDYDFYFDDTNNPYFNKNTSVYLIRPDDYLGLIGNELKIESVETYFQRLGTTQG